MNFSTDSLRGLLSSDGLAAGNRWMVVLPPLNGKRKIGGGSPSNYSADDLNVLCTSARIPGKQLRTIERTVGVVSSRTAVGFEPGDAAFTFYLTHDYTVRKYFQDWIDCVISRSPPYDVGFFDEYKGDILVKQLDKKGAHSYTSKLKDAYPVNIAEVELNNQAQTAALELTVTIAYKDYEVT
jgi:hypothetical protein